MKKNPDHLFNLCKKHDESLWDYIKRFKVEKANIVGCDDRIASSAFKKDLLVEHDLYCELTIAPSQTLVEVSATSERYVFLDDDRITTKKSAKQADPLPKEVGQRGGKPNSMNYGGKRKAPSQDGASTNEGYMKFTIPWWLLVWWEGKKQWT